tara:strand:+ start:10194 stop:10445 length:252 start_codon:yes stop_codon:yes gene_type:complete
MAELADLIVVEAVADLLSAVAVIEQPRFSQGHYVLRYRGLGERECLYNLSACGLPPVLKKLDYGDTSRMGEGPSKCGQGRLFL